MPYRFPPQPSHRIIYAEIFTPLLRCELGGIQSNGRLDQGDVPHSGDLPQHDDAG